MTGFTVKTEIYYLLAMGRYGPGVTYTVPRRATINAPPPMGPLGGLMGDDLPCMQKRAKRAGVDDTTVAECIELV